MQDFWTISSFSHHLLYQATGQSYPSWVRDQEKCPQKPPSKSNSNQPPFSIGWFPGFTIDFCRGKNHHLQKEPQQKMVVMTSRDLHKQQLNQWTVFCVDSASIKKTSFSTVQKIHLQDSFLFLLIQAVTFLGWWVHVTLSRGFLWPPTIGDEKGTAWITW